MSSIDERVVRLSFDNGQFQQGVASTLASLDKLNKGLKLEGATKGFSDVTAASQKVSFKNIEDGVSTIADKFSVLSRIATGALEEIGRKAFTIGSQMVKDMTFAPVMDGFHEYETKLNSIQTILANTQAAGTTLKDVTATLNELNHYSDQTIYNFGEMAKNIGTFTAAGVDLKTSAAAIKGIANLAALSGSNSQQASTAMYQLSQAISSGKVSLEDWNSVVNAGMGGTVFQRALAMNAEKMGTLAKGAVKLKGEMQNVTIAGESFRNSIMAEPGKESWLTSEVLTRTLSQFTGDLTDAELAAQGFNAEQIKAIQSQAAMAKSAATEVKTLSQLMGTLKESLGSGWAQTWELIFGDFTEAKGLFTGISNTLGAIVQNSADSRNKMIQDWKDLGGRTALIDGIGNAFKALVSVLKPIGQAFREIFPKKTGQDLLEMTQRFRDFTEKLKIGSGTAEKLKRVFAGLFAILDIGWEGLKAVVGGIGKLLSLIVGHSGGFLNLAAEAGDFFVAIRKGLQQTDAFHKILVKLGEVLVVPINLLRTLKEHISGLFDGFKGEDAAKSVGGVAEKLSPIARFFDALSSGGDKLNGMFDKFLSNLPTVMDRVISFFKNLGQAVSDGITSLFDDINFDAVLKVINTGLLAGLIVMIKGFMGSFGGGGGGPIDTIKESIDALTDTLGALQSTLRAATLLEIAAAVLMMAIAADRLAKIDSDALKKALKAMAGMLTELLGTMAIMGKIGMGGFISMALGMLIVATSIDILTVAVKALSELSWKELAKGLVGTATLLLGVAVAAKIMSGTGSLISTGLGLLILAGAIKVLVTAVSDLSGFSWEELAKGLIGVGTLLLSLALFTKLADADKGGFSQGLGILLLAAGIKILVSAVQDFSQMSWGEIGKGLTTLAGALTAIAIALKLIPPEAVFSAAGVLLVAASLKLIGDAIGDMGKMDWKTIGKGLTTLAGALVLIAGALKLLPPSSLLSAAAIFTVAASLQLIGDALGQMAGMSWEEIAKGLITLAGALGIIAFGVNMMVGALPGAAAMLVVSASLLIMAGVLQMYAGMTWAEIGQGFLVLAGVFAAFAVAGLLLGPLVPILLALGVAITLLGVGMLAAGAGVLLFAAGLTAISIAGTAAAAALIAIVSGLISLLPLVFEQLGLAIIAFAEAISTAGPKFTEAIVVVLTAIMDAIVQLTPKIVTTLLNLLAALLSTLISYIPRLTDAGMKILLGFLQGVANNIAKVVATAVTVAVKFLEGISQKLPEIIQAGFDLIINFINGVANAIRDNSKKLGEAGGNLASALVEGMINGLAGAAGKVLERVANLASSMVDKAKSIFKVFSPSRVFFAIGEYVAEGLALGVDKKTDMAVKSAENLGESSLSAFKNSIKGFSDTIEGDLDTTYTITPVLDLSEVKKSSEQIPKWLDTGRLNAIAASVTHSRAAAFGYQNNQDQSSPSDVVDPQNGSAFTFNQYNSSPKALSTADIYRQTKNQLSIAREALPV